jgi:hypothetical protein
MTRHNWLELILIVLVLGILGATLTAFSHSLRQSNAFILDKHGLRKETCIALSFDPDSKACIDAGTKKPKQK